MGTIRIETRVVVWRDDGPHVATGNFFVEDPRPDETLVVLTAAQVAGETVEKLVHLIEHDCELPVGNRQRLVGSNDRNN